MTKKDEKPEFEKAVKDILFSKPKHYSRHKHPTREELNKKWRLGQKVD